MRPIDNSNAGSNIFSDRLWLQTGLFILAMVPITSAALLLEQRTFNGINLWIKPLKFQISAVIHLVTLYLVAQMMPPEARRALVLRLVVWASSIATVAEIFIITLRASQATASHYNFSTPLDAMIYGLMGLGALTMLMPALYLGVIFAINRRTFKADFSIGPGVHLGIVLGFIVGALLTIAVAGYMSANGSHWTSGQVSDAGGLLLFGWSTTGGDLRPAHFFALHLMQILPLAGMWADSQFKQDSKKSHITVISTLFVIAGLCVFTFIQALLGSPFLTFD